MGNSGYKNKSVDIPEGSPLFGHRMERTNNFIRTDYECNKYCDTENTSYFQCCAERDNYSKNISKTKLQQLILNRENLR
tara:strand:- start:277 stop:513 length:237 start_codon:yes stop_codon:yes gene_type:complete